MISLLKLEACQRVLSQLGCKIPLTLEEAILEAQIYQEEHFDSWVAEQENVQRIRVNGEEYLSSIKKEAALKRKARDEAIAAQQQETILKETKMQKANALLDDIFSTLEKGEDE